MPHSTTTPMELSAPRLTVEDITYVILRHKWIILLCTLGGLGAAGALYEAWPDTVYRSGAKLFIRYLQESKAPGAVEDDVRIMATDLRGETIINSEVEILTSMDVANSVAAKVGPEVILRKLGGGSDIDAAAASIRGGLTAKAPRGSRVVTLAFEHPDRSLPQRVLKEIIEEYRKKHVEIHRGTGLYDDFLSKETLVLRSRLTETEEELRKVKERAGVISLDESKRTYAEQMSKIRQQLFDSQAELAERKAWYAKTALPPTEDEKVPGDKKREYRNVLALLDAFNRREQELLYSYTAEAPVVAAVRRSITEKEAQKEALEKEFPTLSKLVVPKPTGPVPVVVDEETSIQRLDNRIKVLQQYLEKIRAEASDLGGLELSISDLQRKRDLQEQQYRYFSASLERSRINEALGSDNISNISDIEKPTPPVRDVGKLYKFVAGLGGGGLLLGLGLAFSLEFFVDRSVKRPRELRNVTTAPMLLSIPRMKLRLNGHAGALSRLLPTSNGSSQAHANGTNGSATSAPHALWPPEHPIHLYIESLRNHVIQNFEVRKFSQKPKLVGVTSCEAASGVSTVAAGLAAALSKTGEGKVLLVDMNSGKTTPHYFRNGDPTWDLSEILEEKNLTETSGNDRLFIASTAGNPRSQLPPNRFANFVPKFRGSDFDYVIFDMPPVNQLTTTTQFARHLDLMVLVVEAERTGRDVVDQASMLLNAACGHVGMVLNKTRNYLPRAPYQEA